jgi:LytS/YehU family sensor histidine kinase
MPLKIRIQAKVHEKRLKLTVCNSGSWLEPDDSGKNEYGTGTGLENVKQRLENAFPRHHHLHVRKSSDQVHVIMEIFKN